jgi:hypothetical protein
MSDVLLKPITREILLEKVELWTQNKATVRKTKQQLLQNKAIDKQIQCSNESPAAYGSKIASMPPQKFKAVVFGKLVFGVGTCHIGWLPQRSVFCSWQCSVLEDTLFVSNESLFVADSNKANGVVLKGILKALGIAIVVVGSQSEFISVIESKQVDMAVISCSSNEEHVSTTVHEIR